jgi:hypothetical protein
VFVKKSSIFGPGFEARDRLFARLPVESEYVVAEAALAGMSERSLRFGGIVMNVRASDGFVFERKKKVQCGKMKASSTAMEAGCDLSMVLKGLNRRVQLGVNIKVKE